MRTCRGAIGSKQTVGDGIITTGRAAGPKQGIQGGDTRNTISVTFKICQGDSSNSQYKRQETDTNSLTTTR